MSVRILVSIALAALVATPARSQPRPAPDTVVVRSGTLRLRALVWRPTGAGPFPAVLFNHGSGRGEVGASGAVLHTMEEQANIVAPVFVRHGYVFMCLFRRGTGLSEGQGRISSDVWDSAFNVGGLDARNRLQLQLMQSADLYDAMAALSALRARPEVDARRVAVVGHSYGGSLTMLIAERDSTVRGAVVFSGSARSWANSPGLRARMLAAASRTTIPVHLLFAANDYSVAPGRALSAALTRRGTPNRLTIYPAVGRTAGDGHNFVSRRVSVWEHDVFAFLDPLMR